MKRGVTLVELLVVLSVAALVASIVYPVTARAITSAKIESSVTRLRQLHVAVEIYRADYDLTEFDTINDYPPYSHVYSTYLGFGHEFFRSPCGYVDGIEDNLLRLSYQYVPYPGAQKYFQRFGPASLLFRDPHCDNTAESWNSAYMTKRLLGVRCDGSLLNKRHVGDVTDLPTWSRP